MSLSLMAFAGGACGGLARILMPSASNTASKASVNWPARFVIRNLTGAAPLEVHQEVAGCLCRPRAAGIGGDAGQVDAAGTVLDDDQGVEARRLVADSAGLAAQDRVLVPEHQEHGILGRLTPRHHHQAAGRAAREQIADREDHSAMISARETGHARRDLVIEPYTVVRGAADGPADCRGQRAVLASCRVD